MTSFRRAPFVIATAVSLLAFAVFVGCSNAPPAPTPASQSPKPATKPLKLTVNSWVGWGPLFIAKQKQLFDGLDLDITFIEDTGARRAAMISGQVDAYASSVDNLAVDATFGVTGKTVMCFDESAGGDGIVAKSDVTWENLKGQKVAVQTGLPSHFLLLYVLSKHDLKPSDIEVVELDADKAGSGFVAGTVPIAVTWEPWISKAAEMAGGKILVTTKDLPGVIVDTLVIRDPVLDARPDDVRRLVKGWFRALDWYETHADEGNQIIAQAYKLKPEEVKDMVSGVRFYNLKQNRKFMGTAADPGPIYKVFDEASRLWKEAGVIKATVESNRYIDASYLE